MADVFVEENSLKGIANAIRSKNGSSATYTPAEMEQAILDLQIPDVSALDATAADILAPKVAFTADGETEGTIQTKSASDVTVSGDTVSAPAGYYPSAVSKSVQAGSATTPATIIPVEPTISVNNSTGLVTASVNETQAITPAVSEGYVSAGAPGNVRASGSATSQLPIQSAATITPTRSQQTAVAAGKFTTGNVVVDPIPDEYIIPTGTKSITITANGTTTEDVTNYASAQITANVPNTYAAADEGKVVNNGTLVSQSSDTVTANDTYDTTLINSLTVNVSGGGGGSVESGSFTPATNTQQYSINLNSDTYKLVVYWLSPDSPTALNHSLRVDYCKGFRLNAGALSRLFGIYSNAGGSSWSGALTTTGSESSTFANGVLTIKGNYLIAGCTYNWVAVP